MSMVIEWAALHQSELLQKLATAARGYPGREDSTVRLRERPMLPRVNRVRHVDAYLLELGFTDGEAGVVDFRDRVVGRGGVFRALEDVEFFSRVEVQPEAGTVVWPDGVDFCPDVLYSLATGGSLRHLQTK
jgi:hypothetical protein